MKEVNVSAEEAYKPWHEAKDVLMEKYHNEAECAIAYAGACAMQLGYEYITENQLWLLVDALTDLGGDDEAKTLEQESASNEQSGI